MPPLPQPRGPLSDHLFTELTSAGGPLSGPDDVSVDDPLRDDDLHLALYACYELAYRGFDGVAEEWESAPALVAFRGVLEAVFADALAEAVGPLPDPPPPDEMDLALRAIADADDAPSLSRFVEREADLDQVKEFVIHRSAYQLKESDPHAWALPRLSGKPKAALVEILYDEYGGGDAARVHAQLFADTMDALGLDSSYGAYLDRIPGVTLATVNLMSLLGMHRRFRGAICGHLALFEMTSSVPNHRYADGLRRLGMGERATAFFDEHVVADAVHENIAAVDLAGGLAHAEPAVANDILWGARALNLVEGNWARHLTSAWNRGETSLLNSVARAPVSGARATEFG
ncbi:MAG TPA: iron-containing redox enzyme family protein [Thermoleophilaceae bacterium]|nr:iron-containing redox enzyme family protein [Thermoleophilaceae bacterium]